MKNEPVITRASVAAVIVALATLIGVTVDQGLVEAVAYFVAFLAPIVSGLLARRKVTPVE